MTVSPTPIPPFQLGLTILMLTAHSLSALGCLFICVCYLFLPHDAHFRHRLIQNLAVADFWNHSVGTFPQVYRLVHRHGLSQGVGCQVDAVLAMLPTQAVDMTILAIAIVIVVGIIHPETFVAMPRWKKVAIISAIWVLPVTNTFTALGKGYMEPVSGGWCWIKPEPVYLRYVLMHGWRFFGIFLTIMLYTYLHIHLRRHFKFLGGEGMAGIRSQKSIRKTLLLRAYPTFYVILWLPGIINRIVEATGNKSKALTVMQASTAFVGLANAFTYGINEEVVKSLRKRFGRRESESMSDLSDEWEEKSKHSQRTDSSRSQSESGSGSLRQSQPVQ